MRLARYLQHWLSGIGISLQVTDYVPETDPIRQWADTFPWATLVSAIEQSFAQRFPKQSARGRRPVPICVLLALELLKHELGASDEDICHRLRTDFAVMYACGLREYRINSSRAHFVLPATCASFVAALTKSSAVAAKGMSSSSSCAKPNTSSWNWVNLSPLGPNRLTSACARRRL